MTITLAIPETLARAARSFLFQNKLEQGVFFFARAQRTVHDVRIEVVDAHHVPPAGWAIQDSAYLEMTDEERAKIMARARQTGTAVVDCHSHPGSRDSVWFSPSDLRGITEFAAYAKWKLGGKPYVAMVWGEDSIDAVVWDGAFLTAQRIDEVLVIGDNPKTLVPRGTWFDQPKTVWELPDDE